MKTATMFTLLLATGLVLGLTALVTPRVASANGPAPTKIEVHAPTGVVTGSPIEVLARLTGNDGQPIAGQELTLRRGLEFLSTGDNVELDTAVTDDQGIARFTFAPGLSGDASLTVSFAGNTQLAAATADDLMPVAEGPSSYLEQAGINVPGIGLWLLVAILGTIWGVFLAVMGLLVLIGSEGRQIEVTGAAHHA